jgi:hypothetical protein
VGHFHNAAVDAPEDIAVRLDFWRIEEQRRMPYLWPQLDTDEDDAAVGRCKNGIADVACEVEALVATGTSAGITGLGCSAVTPA